ncbi:MAG: ABC transporter ATP-binding protein [Desulfobacter sp.]|nr:MAG: ABC transporter ATP-binding protein [Desulfobacter sp.]
MLSVDHLEYSFGRRRVLEDISFTVDKGELCGLFGPNGSGKTTLFQCCLGFLRPDRGRVRLGGRDLKEMKIRETARQAAYVPQHHTPPFPYRVDEMVLMGRTPHMSRFYRPSGRDRAAARAAMERVGISDLAGESYDILSGGQRQLVLIARAIAQETDFIFLDEPTSALDFRNQTMVWNCLRQIADQGTGILACSHDPNHVSWFCDTAVVLGPSGVAARGVPEKVFSQDLMDEIYGGACEVSRAMDVKIILPSGLTRGRRVPAG